MVRHTSLLAGKRRFFGSASVVCGAVLMLSSGVFANGTVNQIGNDILGVAPSNDFGYSVAMSSDGSRIAIGSPFGSSNGVVRIYEFDGNAWEKLGADIVGESSNDQSGWSVSMSSDGTRVAIGARFNNFGGHVRVYELDNGTWQQVGGDIDSEAQGDTSGWSVGLSADGSRVAIGAPNNYADTQNSQDKRGHVRVFQLTNGAWQQMGSDIDGAASREQSGWTVAISSDGSHVIIGAPYSTKGNARVYKWNSNSWEKVGQDLTGDADGDLFGWTVAISANGKRAIVGAPYNDDAASNSGHARVFEWDDSANPPAWQQVGSALTGNPTYHEFGHAVAISSDGTVIAIGGPYDQSPSAPQYKGIVRLYQLQNDTWTQVGVDLAGNARNDWLGFSLAMSQNGKRIISGAPGSTSRTGFARVFGIIESPSAPTITSITPTADGLSVAFTPPASNGGARITNYEYSLDNGTTWTLRSPAAATSPLVISGVTPSSQYTVRLRAINSIGSGASSNSVASNMTVANPADATSSTTTTVSDTAVAQKSTTKSSPEELPASGSNTVILITLAVAFLVLGLTLLRDQNFSEDCIQHKTDHTN